MEGSCSVSNLTAVDVSFRFDDAGVLQWLASSMIASSWLASENFATAPQGGKPTIDDGTNDLVNLSITGGVGGSVADRVVGDRSESARSLRRLDGAERPLELAVFHRISGRPIINWLQEGRNSPPQHCVRCMRRLWWVEETGVPLKRREKSASEQRASNTRTTTLTTFGLYSPTTYPELPATLHDLRMTFLMPRIPTWFLTYLLEASGKLQLMQRASPIHVTWIIHLPDSLRRNQNPGLTLIMEATAETVSYCSLVGSRRVLASSKPLKTALLKARRMSFQTSTETLAIPTTTCFRSIAQRGWSLTPCIHQVTRKI
jgi:hypothetical protein